MKKIIYTTLFSLSVFTAFGQNSIGINTEDPQETVDVNGTMRIKDVTGSNNTTSLLAIDENGKVVKMPTKTNNFTPFIYKRYKINTNPRPRSRDSKARANNIALGIDADNYVAILVQASLVKRSYSYGGGQGAFPLASTRLNNREFTRRIKINEGTLKDDSNQDLLGGGKDYNNQVVAFGISSQEASLTKRNGDYYFSADYPGTDFAGNDNYSWVISVLVINRNWTLTKFSTLN